MGRGVPGGVRPGQRSGEANGQCCAAPMGSVSCTVFLHADTHAAWCLSPGAAPNTPASEMPQASAAMGPRVPACHCHPAALPRGSWAISSVFLSLNYSQARLPHGSVVLTAGHSVHPLGQRKFNKWWPLFVSTGDINHKSSNDPLQCRITSFERKYAARTSSISILQRHSQRP